MRRAYTIRFVAGLIILLGVVIVIFRWDFSYGKPSSFGVTFSIPFANDLGLDWRAAYIATLDELNISHIRLPVYWNQIEPKPGEFNFSDVDWQVGEAGKRSRQVILVIGRRVPRWPECHEPSWASPLSPAEQQQGILSMLEVVVNRYKDNPAVTGWQVENEPLLRWFGLCPKPDKAFLKQEVAKVRELDTRPILITESGELSTWQRAAGLADILGTTMYRVVWNRYLGFWDYVFVPPAFYAFKAGLVQLFHRQVEQVIVSELQMEPWATGKRMVEMTQAERERSFDLKRFQSNISYVKRTGFPQVYLWGVEYWYWLKTKGQPQIWEEAKKLWPLPAQ